MEAQKYAYLEFIQIDFFNFFAIILYLPDIQVFTKIRIYKNRPFFAYFGT